MIDPFSVSENRILINSDIDFEVGIGMFLVETSLTVPSVSALGGEDEK
jgi:hypothetical protein